ncbi:excisionase family DNA-binding protein [Symbioplanes lichenis]|uniref:excisionase family DNA-binding protein n=1 Tax=Symbioplanes lichenis TaxID=1629072 RepID=UPI002739A86F|nr:excisionase family DNA-binding protein [Actinoplanes lichenis]
MVNAAVASVPERREEYAAVQRLLASPDLPAAEVMLVRDGVAAPMPPELADLVWQLARSLADGDGVTVVPLPAELSTTEAAHLLRISRPTLVKALDAGELPSRKAGTHRRIAARDVLAYREVLIDRHYRAYEALMEYSDDLGLDQK